MDIFSDTPTVLWELTRRGRILRCSVRMLRSGLEMQMAYDDREPYFRWTFESQEALQLGVEEERNPYEPRRAHWAWQSVRG